jgi:hypothetical protein
MIGGMKFASMSMQSKRPLFAFGAHKVATLFDCLSDVWHSGELHTINSGLGMQLTKPKYFNARIAFTWIQPTMAETITSSYSRCDDTSHLEHEVNK